LTTDDLKKKKNLIYLMAYQKHGLSPGLGVGKWNIFDLKMSQEGLSALSTPPAYVALDQLL